MNRFRDDLHEPGWRRDYPHLSQRRGEENNGDWWKRATAVALVRLFREGYFEEEPVFYTYDLGSDVYYEGNTVYVNQQPTPADIYATQAQEIAALGVPPQSGSSAPGAAAEVPERSPKAPQATWMPLGVFALSTSRDETTPTRFMQLAISDAGKIAGTLFNTQTKATLPLIGSVDKKSQRACWYAGEKSEVVAETSLFNLTKDEAPILIHFGKDRTEECLLVRLDPPASAN